MKPKAKKSTEGGKSKTTYPLQKTQPNQVVTKYHAGKKKG